MTKKEMLLIAMLLSCGYAAVGQSSTTSGSTGTRSYAYYNNLFRIDAYRTFGDSARAEKMHARWQGFWSDRAAYDAPDSISALAPVNVALTDFILSGSLSTCSGNGYKGSWKTLGPQKDYHDQTEDHAGRITALWISPTDTSHILAGAGAGGLWETHNSGKTWSNITDGAENDQLPGTMGVTDIAVNPVNFSNIYIATGTAEAYTTNLNGITQRISVGLMYSTDGGASWDIDTDFRTITGKDDVDGWSEDFIRKMAYTRSGRLIVMTTRNIYMKPVSGAWANITPADFSSLPPDYLLADFDTTRLAASGRKVVFATTADNNTQYLYYYNDVAGTWAARRTLSFDPLQSDVEVVNGLDLSKSDSVCLLLQVPNPADPNNPKGHLYKTGLSSGALLLRHNNLGKDQRDVACSGKVEGIMYMTNTRGYADFIYRSVDNGLTFAGVGYTHADGRTLQVYSSGTNTTGLDDVVFCGTDGGVAKKRAGSTGTNNFISLSGQGLNITQFMALSSSKTNNSLSIAGAQDNGTQAWIRAMSPTWKEVQGSDGMVPAFSSNGDTVALSQFQHGINSKATRFEPVAGMVGNSSTGTYNPPDNTGLFNNPDLRRWRRPLKFDHTNTARSGFHFIFKTSDLAVTWSPSFGPSLAVMNEPKPLITMATTPENLALIQEFKRPVDFHISEQSPNVGYIAYDNRIKDETKAIINSGNLFRSITLTSGSPTWQMVNPTPWDLPITDIEVDPVAPNRIWVSFGGVRTWEIGYPDAARVARVYYSDNYGESNSWVDMSYGLTALPVNKIVYVPGSDDVLFAGTDVGVYRWNKAGSIWECFNEGMPRCIISDMEVLTCSGTLRVSTYGRGMWETPYNEVYETFPGDVYTINANTTWSQSNTIEGNIRVKAGKTLTISGSNTTIYMPLLGRIYVEKGAKLVLDGARITNGCDSSQWSGIVLAGDKALSPAEANQGTFEMKNGAVIENAAVGVRDYSDGTLQGGGRIIASNSTFLNCRKAVALNDYPGYDRSTTCTFTGVTFKINSDRVMAAGPGPLPPYQFTAFNERGVKLTGCTFTDERTLSHGDKRATAIAVTDADFTADGCQFNRMLKGIYANVVYVNPMAPKPTIVGSTFDSCRENITIYAHNPLVRSNTFTWLMPDVAVGNNKPAWAAYLEGTRGASVFNNTISGSNAATLNMTLNAQKFGVIGKDAGTTWSTLWQGANVINNSLTNVMVGLQTERQNLGLTVNCNSFTRNTYAFRINPLSGGMTGPLIREQNGSCSSSDTRPNNTFSNNSVGIKSWISASADYLKYYVNAAGSGNFIPTGNSGGVAVVSCSGLSQVDLNAKCDRSPVITWNSAALSSAVSAFNSAKAADPNSEETWYRYGEVVRGYTQLDNLAGLRSFLLSDNTDVSKIQLLPIYLSEGNYQTIASTISGLSASGADKTAYSSYFNILIALRQSNRSILQLTQNEQSTMQSLANGQTHIANAAKSLLEWGCGVTWNHIPEEPAQPRPGGGAETDAIEDIANRSRLGDAAPNPVAGTTQIPVWVLPYDAANGCYLVVRDIMGKEMTHYQLREGDNIVWVNTATWAPGIYAYSLLVDNQPIATKKFSKIK